MGNREVARIYGENRRQEVNRHDASFFWSFLPTHFSITLLRNGPTRIAFAMALVYIAVLSMQFRSARRKRSDALARMSERLRPEFEERHERSLAGLLPVGACPDRSYRRYERDTAWDVGYLESPPASITMATSRRFTCLTRRLSAFASWARSAPGSN